MTTNTADGGCVTYDDVSYATLTTLERQISTLTQEVAANEGALAACRASASECEVRRSTIRTQSDAARKRLADGRNAAASVLGAVKLSEDAHSETIIVRKCVFQLLSQTMDAVDRVLIVAQGVDDLVAEVDTYRKNHLVSDVLMDGVTKVGTVAQSLVDAAIGAVGAAITACLAASGAETAAASVPRQGITLWGRLDRRGADPLRLIPLKGVNALVLGTPAVDSVELLVRSVSRFGYSINAGEPRAGLLHVLADTDRVMSDHHRQLEAAVSQGQLEINSLEQTLANQKAALRAAQLALDGARAALGAQF